MNNNINNNVGINPVASNVPNVNTNSNIITNANVAQNVVPTVNPTGVTPGVSSIPNVNVMSSNMVNSQNNISNQNGIASNTYVIVGSIVGIVLLAAVFLLVLLVTGVIGNRNRLTCTKTVNESGFVYTEKRVYKFDKGLYTSVDKTYIYNYANLTDEIYNNDFAALLDTNSRVSTYGFGTEISREGNVVTITAYEPKYFDKTVDDINTSNNKEGFTCE